VTVSVQEVVERIATILGRPIRIETDPAKVRAVERAQLQADVRALRALIGWAPHGDLTRGLRELLVYEGVVREGVAQ
jgi:nucleoside-diphosphate-sugar epimerase